MDYSLDGNDDDENNEYAEMAENQEEPEYSQKDAILFVVDARKEMCEPGANGSPSPLAQALGCVQLLRCFSQFDREPRVCCALFQPNRPLAASCWA